MLKKSDQSMVLYVGFFKKSQLVKLNLFIYFIAFPNSEVVQIITLNIISYKVKFINLI